MSSKNFQILTSGFETKNCWKAHFRRNLWYLTPQEQNLEHNFNFENSG